MGVLKGRGEKYKVQNYGWKFIVELPVTRKGGILTKWLLEKSF
jgi:hypothetical protein